MSYGVVYLVTNLHNGKRYVGQICSDPEVYWRRHLQAAKKKSERIFYKAIRKYGEENFTFEVIWYAEDKISLDISEDSFIKLFETMVPLGYNLRGGGSRGLHSQSAKDKMRLSRSLPEVRARYSAAYAKPEVRLKRSLAAFDVQNRPEVLVKKSASLKTYNLRPETKVIRAEFENRPDIKERRRAAAKAQMADPIFLAAHRARMTEIMNKPEVKQRHIDAHNTEETKAKLREINIGARCINNGEINSRISAGVSLPAGWNYGMVSYNKNTPARVASRHKRWHVNRGIKDASCALCQLQSDEEA